MGAHLEQKELGPQKGVATLRTGPEPNAWSFEIRESYDPFDLRVVRDYAEHLRELRALLVRQSEFQSSPDAEKSWREEVAIRIDNLPRYASHIAAQVSEWDRRFSGAESSFAERENTDESRGRAISIDMNVSRIQESVQDSGIDVEKLKGAFNSLVKLLGVDDLLLKDSELVMPSANHSPRRTMQQVPPAA